MLETRDYEYVKRHDYHTRSNRFLCGAVREMAEYKALGYDCFVFSETYTPMLFTVYYLAYKKLGVPTRKERGCNV